MNDVEKNKVYLVTGVVIAIDESDGILIAGMLSDSPFIAEDTESTKTKDLVGSFAFTRQKAEFLRDRLNDFLQE
ncbi:hypothetical protein IQ270_28015 [Microcoleus sp. LEGE 07076]|uniref:hypothetical protein n=1 Tax=Microcoleus sp. LEGE 07076 TaxID=915322 RepID=UPI00187F9E64|nr:hypothetical protein [Microcoleus sp. LEGE 07076]MBE9188375.1 hypothetical protein [Microcoleus sp. LEGE 07076]